MRKFFQKSLAIYGKCYTFATGYLMLTLTITNNIINHKP